MSKFLKAILASLIVCTSAMAEGTKQLRPQQSDFGNLHIRPGDPDYTPFGLFNAPDDNQLKLYISDISETLYFGMNNRNEGNGGGRGFVNNVEFRILSPSGAIVYESFMPSLGQEGNIPNWDQAVTGPAEIVGAGGYDAIQLNFTEVGDYIIEFDPPGNQYIDINLFDFTVVNASNQIMDGRLHSKAWQLTTQSFDNAFNGTLYPYHPDGIVYEVDFNQIRPYLFVVNFNSTGTDSTGIFLDDRMSKNQQRTYPEFEVFLNPPDENAYPRFKREIYFDASITNNSCELTEICMTFSSNAPGSVEGFLDFNGNGVYDEDAGELYFGDQLQSGVETCIEWDGNDANGNRVDQRNMQMISSFGYGVMHLPIYDAENHENGFQVKVHSPEGLKDPALFWDDRNISNKGQALDRIRNLVGCTATDGCHKWRNRGVNNNNSETINTWWYSEVLYDTLVFQNIWNRPVNLSFDPDVLDKDTRTVCEGDSVNFYVHNDVVHFDTEFFDYEWFINGTPVPETDVRNIIKPISGTSNIRVVATDKTALACASQDVLTVNTVPPLEIVANVVDETCTNSGNRIAVSIVNGPPNPVASWTEFPGNNNLTITGLDAGIYHLHLEDDDFSERCLVDTSFEITNYIGIEIDELVLENTYCLPAAGTAEVTMKDLARTYQYSWNNGGFGSNSSISSLPANNHTLVVREPATGCEDDTTFTITGESFDFTLTSTNEICGNGTGTLDIELPTAGGPFEIFFQGTKTNKTAFTNLNANNYLVRVVSSLGAGCEAQHTGVVGNTIEQLFIDQLDLTPSECYKPTGTAGITMQDLTKSYKYSWDSGVLGTKTSLTQLSPGTHTVRIVDVNTTCETDSVFQILRLPLIVTPEPKNELCKDKEGEIKLSVPDGDFQITWDGVVGGKTLSGLSAGTYQYSVVANYSASCRVDNAITLINENRTIPLESIITQPSNCGTPNGLAEFVLTNTGRNYLFSWQGGDFTTKRGYNQLGVGDYTMTIIEKGTKCFLDTNVRIPGAGFRFNTAATNDYCSNGNGTLTVEVNDPNARILWSDGSTSFDRKGVKTGVYNFTLTNGVDPACLATGALEVYDDESFVEADFSYFSLVNGPVVALGDVVQFVDESKGNIARYRWNFDGEGRANVANPEHVFNTYREYDITLRVTDVYGCTDEVTKPLPVQYKTPCGAALPNAFSPNADQMNDNIGLLGIAYDVDLRIYNRWGEIIFRGYNDEDRWDGTYRGEDSPIGSYPYTLEYTCPDNRGNMVKERKVGDISLIR